MRVLLDHNVPKQLRLKLGKHLVMTAAQREWDLLANGNLLRAAEGEGFEVLVTADKDFLAYEALSGRSIAIVFLSTNHWPSLDAAQEAIRAALEQAEPGSFRRVAIPLQRP